MKNKFLIFTFIFFFLSLCSLTFAQNQSDSSSGDKCLNPKTGKWEPKTDPKASCEPLRLNSRIFKDPKTGLNLLVIDNFIFADLYFEITTSSKDFSGGLVWHYANLDNNYTAMVNLKGKQIEIYKMADGKKITLKKGKISTDNASTHTFKITSKANKIQFFDNGKLSLEASDETFKKGTFGYWSKESDNIHMKYGNLIP